jgi:hypothetical protein
MRGETVDFDLLKIKQKLQGKDAPDEVEKRGQYIDIRRRRNPRRSVSDLIAEQERNENDVAQRIRDSKAAKAANPTPKAEKVVAPPAEDLPEPKKSSAPAIEIAEPREIVKVDPPEVTEVTKKIVKRTKKSKE